jgi:hypothetical protein
MDITEEELQEAQNFFKLVIGNYEKRSYYDSNHHTKKPKMPISFDPAVFRNFAKRCG